MLCEACPKEAQTQSEHSPCVVEGHERILYVLLDPDDINDGQIAATAFKKSDLKSCSLSVCRVEYSESSEVFDRIVNPKLEKNSERQLVGGFSVICSRIRDLAIDGRRTFCVIDDGLEDYCAHAVIGFSDVTKEKDYWQKNNREKARADLVYLFESGGIVDLSTFDFGKIHREARASNSDIKLQSPVTEGQPGSAVD
ncbi:hypothetical protein GGQ86_003039 [Xanthobacter flavus]|uniref:Uncharacterized protein n=1 Tax=Xanthobacter flavus TaxID=281 RepID=A0A9W6CJ66_XANFL|nr:hypothetical protein [Xanthobacter flavus]MDR6334557.1 hypothetical protein [Xanthobacter flavus]GLI23426.1 hypothetical protein XFLAVUS301_31000 [Xanthobacter flavus]